MSAYKIKEEWKDGKSLIEDYNYSSTIFRKPCSKAPGNWKRLSFPLKVTTITDGIWFCGGPSHIQSSCLYVFFFLLAFSDEVCYNYKRRKPYCLFSHSFERRKKWI